MTAMTDSFVPVLLRETERLWKQHSHREFVIWMKTQIVDDFAKPIAHYFTQSSTLRTHKLLQVIFKESTKRSENEIQIGAEETVISPQQLESFAEILFPKIVHQILVSGDEHVKQQEVYERPLIVLIFRFLFERLSPSTDWFTLHFLPTILEGIEYRSSIAIELLEMILERKEYFPLLFSSEERNLSRSVHVSGIQSMFKLLYESHSKNARAIVFQHWYHTWDLVEDELNVLAQSPSAETQKNKLLIVSQQWEKVLRLFEICGDINQTDFLDFVEKSFLRFLSFIHPNSATDSFYIRVFQHFLFSGNADEEKLFHKYLQLLCEQLSLSPDCKDFVLHVIRDSISKLTLAELPSLNISLRSRNNGKSSNGKFGLKLLASVLHSDAINVVHMVVSALVESKSLENIFQILRMSTIEESKSEALGILLVVHQFIFEPSESVREYLQEAFPPRECVKQFWNKSRLQSLFDWDIATENSHCLFQLISKYIVDYTVVETEIIPSLCFKLLGDLELSDSRSVMGMISYLIHNACQTVSQQVHIIHITLDFARDSLYSCTAAISDQASPNPHILGLVLCILSIYKQLRRENTKAENEMEKTEEQFFALIQESLLALGTHSDTIFLAQIQLLSSYCCNERASNRTIELLEQNRMIIKKGCHSKVFVINQMCESILSWMESKEGN